jgi:hypothetical protein
MVIFDERVACAHIFLSGGAAANHVAALCTESAAIGTRWVVKKGAGCSANSRHGGGRSGGLDPCLAGWGLVCNGGGSLEQHWPDEILGNLWEAVLALRIEDGIGGVLDREPMQLGDKFCKLSVLVHPGLQLGVLLFEIHCACLILWLLSGRHVTIAVILEPVVTLQVSVMQRVTVLPEWAQVMVLTSEEALHPVVGVSWPRANGVTGLIAKATLQGPVELHIGEVSTCGSEHIVKLIWLVGWVLGLHGKQAGSEDFPVIRVKPVEKFCTVIIVRNLVSELQGVSNCEEASVILHDVILIMHAGMCGHINKVHQALPGVAHGSSGIRVQVIQGSLEGNPVTCTEAVEHPPEVAHGEGNVLQDTFHLLLVGEAVTGGDHVILM